jgi:HipA-like protein
MKLHVAFRNDSVGDLIATDGRFAFTYDDAWLGNPDAFPLSVQMQLSRKDWPSEIAHPFFANLLPEGPSRQIYAERLGVAYDDDVHLLAAIGGDTAGALTFGEGRPQKSRHRSRQEHLTCTHRIWTRIGAFLRPGVHAGLQERRSTAGVLGRWFKGF